MFTMTDFIIFAERFTFFEMAPYSHRSGQRHDPFFLQMNTSEPMSD